ncbi:MAG: hypothetical protein WDM85_07960 [Caulobacteraceae bacterium]
MEAWRQGGARPSFTRGGCWPSPARRRSRSRASASQAARCRRWLPASSTPPPGATLIDLKDWFVLPGLIDCHVHLTMQLGPGMRLALVEDSDPKTGLEAAHRARLTLEAGFTRCATLARASRR